MAYLHNKKCLEAWGLQACLNLQGRWKYRQQNYSLDCFELAAHELPNDFCQNVVGLLKSTRGRGQGGDRTFWLHYCWCPRWVYGPWPIDRVHSIVKHKSNVGLVCCSSVYSEPMGVWQCKSLVHALLWPWASKGDAKTHERNTIQQGIQTLDNCEFGSSQSAKSIGKK